MRIIFVGMKGCGKTTLGTLLAEKLQIPFIDSDASIEKMHEQERGEAIPFREIFKKYGEQYFSALDSKTLKQIAKRSEEHTSELQSPDHLVCRLLLEKKKTSLARVVLVLRTRSAHSCTVRRLY